MLRDLNNTIFLRIEALLPLLPLLARGVFATSLLIYFWTAGVTKLGPGSSAFYHCTRRVYSDPAQSHGTDQL